MNEDKAEAALSVLCPLLRALEMLMFISRNLHPLDFEELMASVGTPDEELKSALARPLQWPQRPPDIGTLLGAACDAALGAFAGLLIGDGRHQRGLLGFLRIRVELVDPLEYLRSFGAAALVEFFLGVLIHRIRRTGIERARIAAAKQRPH